MSAVVNHLSFNFVNQLVHIIDIGIILNRSRVIAAPGRLSTLWEKESCRGRASTLERASGGLVPPGRVTVSIDALRVKEVTTHQRFQSLCVGWSNRQNLHTDQLQLSMVHKTTINETCLPGPDSSPNGK